jgi:membrane protease YdiL (CAAX protease family)
MINLTTPKEFVCGVVLALSSMILIGLSALAAGANFDLIMKFDYSYYILVFDAFFIAGFEELLFRGVIFQAFLERFGKYVSVFLFSLIFAFAHYFNAEFTPIFFLNLFLAGILFSAMYIQTKSLWFGISFHFVWNIAQSQLIGSPVSGLVSQSCFANFHTGALPEYLFGGMLGVEGGLLCTAVLLINLYIVLKFATPSPYISAPLFKRYYAESELIYKLDKNISLTED